MSCNASDGGLRGWRHTLRVSIGPPKRTERRNQSVLPKRTSGAYFTLQVGHPLVKEGRGPEGPLAEGNAESRRIMVTRINPAPLPCGSLLQFIITISSSHRFRAVPWLASSMPCREMPTLDPHVASTISTR